MAVTGGEKRGPEPAANIPKGSPNPDQTAESFGPEPSEERTRALLQAYQETLDTIEELPALVWAPWDRKRPGSYFKVPYVSWFLVYFVVHHIYRSLDTLNRRFHVIAAVSGDPDTNRTNREAVKLYLQSLPRLHYRIV